MPFAYWRTILDVYGSGSSALRNGIVGRLTGPRRLVCQKRPASAAHETLTYVIRVRILPGDCPVIRDLEWAGVLSVRSLEGRVVSACSADEGGFDAITLEVSPDNSAPLVYSIAERTANVEE